MASNNTNAIGSVATSSAVTPDGRMRSAQITAPVPQRKSRAPVTAEPNHCERVGRACPFERAQANITIPATMNRTPCVVKAGSVSIENRMPR